MGETISLDDYTTLPGKSGATHSISLCIANLNLNLNLKNAHHGFDERPWTGSTITVTFYLNGSPTRAYGAGLRRSPCIEPRARSPGVHLTPTRVSVGTFTIRPDVPRDAAAPMNSMLLSGTKSRRGFSDAANI
jgi:hypothetical protein